MKRPRRRFSDFIYQPTQLRTHRLKSLLVIGLFVLGGLQTALSTLNAEEPTAIAQAEVKQQATGAARVEQAEKQTRQVRIENYDLSRYPVNDSNERHWRNILWTTAVVEPQEAFVAQTVTNVLTMTTQRGLSNSQTRTVDMAMQVGTQLYLSNPTLYASIGQQFRQTIDRSADPQWVAMALSGLVKADITPAQVNQLTDRVRSRFPKWSQNAFLYTTLREISAALNPPATPPLRDLLNWTIAAKQPQLYVLCRPDRGVLCQAVLKDRQGKFVRQNGQIWSMPLLLRSLHGLSWNFVRGQTPQGIYRIEGMIPQPDDEFFRAYGHFSLINLFVPFEPGAREFLPGHKGAFRGGLNAYRALLPASWRNYFPMQQSYWAGKIGRSLFRIHGTGESPDFFKGKERYPQESYNWNPTIGCLSALELYDQTGVLRQADMPELLRVFRMVGGSNFAGYMVVAELPNQSAEPISIEEIEAAVNQ